MFNIAKFGNNNCITIIEGRKNMSSFVVASLIVLVALVVVLTIIMTLALCKIAGDEDRDMERKFHNRD